ncbi:adenylate/guanylate cyclase domain-containing protein [Aestuariivirga sp.]|jgi:class 3 adenylate cyclase|uniref:adenylate/guanylate cyclase domain-containing protein n=1 Tax=Aestuariivirga sp. TaxID=2650926 RepID=UPI00378310CF
MPTDRSPSCQTQEDTIKRLRAELSDMQLLYEATLAHSDVIEAELDRKNQQLQDLSEKLSLYLAPQVYQAIFSGRRDVQIHATRKNLTIFFSDIVGFTEITDSLEPEELASLLNEYMTDVTTTAHRYGATVNKYIGDAVVAFFGDPDSAGEVTDALRCVEMAIEIQKRLPELRKNWAARGIQRPIHCRIGINTGCCTVGNFGSSTRMDYTAIGGAMNLAARIQSLAETDEILVSHTTWALVHDRIPLIEREPAILKGFTTPERLYRVVASSNADQDDAIADKGQR